MDKIVCLLVRIVVYKHVQVDVVEVVVVTVKGIVLELVEVVADMDVLGDVQVEICLFHIKKRWV